MRYVRFHHIHLHLSAGIITAASIFLLTVFGHAQSAPAKPVGDPFAEIEKKYPGLVPELGHLVDRLKHEVKLPPQREESNLLPRLPGSTTFYAAFPNVGEAVHQAMVIFSDELQKSAPLHDWWQQSDMAKSGPLVESSMEKFYELSQYLGDEIVIAGGTEGSAPHGVLVAELRKPGLENFLRQMLGDFPQKSTDIHILSPQELASAASNPRPNSTPGAIKASQVFVLVRSDVAVVGSDLAVLSSFNELLDATTGGATEPSKKSAQFTSTAFGERVAQAYQGGASVVAAADLHKIIAQATAGKKPNQEAIEDSGFKDVKYVVWEHRNIGGEPVGEMELSFVGPRHGAAAWLAEPAPHGSLDFVSPKSAMVFSIILKNLAAIFDDIKAFPSSGPNTFAALPQMEQALHFSLRDDLLSQFRGEITVAIDDVTTVPPQWEAVLRVEDSERVQTTLDKLLKSTPVFSRQIEQDEIVYHTVTIPSAQKPTEVAYAFADGYLILASSQKSAAEAIRIHHSGESLAKSPKFLASLPPGHSRETSALFYEEASGMTAFRLRQISPELAEAMSHLNGGPSPIVFCGYAEEKSIRGVSIGGGADAMGILIGGAIAIPNLMRAKGAANESTAVSTVRALNVAQRTYSSKYLQAGYARDLASLGPDPRDGAPKTAKHAGLIDADLGNASCTSGAWCEKAGYRFSIAAVCQLRSCNEFVVVATPVAFTTGAKSFCSTSDGVVRFKAGSLLMSPVSPMACKEWTPLQ
ncbi:MAG: hypothetical protein WCB53_10335 [Terriglobales bacterium]